LTQKKDKKSVLICVNLWLNAEIMDLSLKVSGS
jgi:hypothetical protein